MRTFIPSPPPARLSKVTNTLKTPKPNPDLAIIHAEITLMPEDYGSSESEDDESGKWVLCGPCEGGEVLFPM